MKKILYCFLLITGAIHNGVSGQQLSEWEMKKLLPARIDSFLIGFMQASELRAPGTETYSDQVEQAYVAYFTTDAKVYNEMTPALLEGDRDHPFYLKFSSLSDYISKVKKNFPGGLHQNLVQYTADYSKLSSGILNLILQKIVFGTSVEGYLFKNSDTINVEIKTGNNLSEFKISRILKLGSQFTIVNDGDKDLIIDLNDKCPDVAGLASYQGCPPPSHPAAYFGFQFNFGISTTTTIDGPVKSNLGYDRIIDQTFNMSPVSIDNSQSGQFGVTIQYDRFYGRKKLIGVGIGISYQHYSTELDMDNFFVEYHSIDQFGKEYRRVVRSQSVIAENIKMNSLMIPLTLKFKKKLFSKGGVFADVGMAFSLMPSGSSKVNTSFDYEAIYSYDRNTGKFVFDSNVIPGNSDWLIQEDFIKSLNGNNVSSTNSYFQSRKDIGFDVAVNKSVNQSSTFKLKSSFALLLDGGLYYSILENADLCLGLMYLSDSKKNDISSGYKITDKSGEYSSIVNGSEKITNNSLGITLGIKFSLK